MRKEDKEREAHTCLHKQLLVPLVLILQHLYLVAQLLNLLCWTQ